MTNNSIQELNNTLHDINNNEVVKKPLFVFITGASGTGKTYLTQQLTKRLNQKFVHIAYFDSIGVPSTEDMINVYGSPEKWQEASTHSWIKQLLALRNEKLIIILEGQYNPQFALDACKKLAIEYFIFIDIDTTRKERENRLIQFRNQPELVHEDMNIWANFLKQKTLEVGGSIIDSSESDTSKNLAEIAHLIKEKIRNIYFLI